MQEHGSSELSEDVDRATTLLVDNLRLLTGHEPARRCLLRGHRHVHRLAVSWPSHDDPQVCMQVVPDMAADFDSTFGGQGWRPSDARAVAECLDLKLTHGERHPGGITTFDQWRRAASPGYFVVLLDASPADRRDAELTRRCALLESGYVDGAGWLRFYADGQFAEGSFTRVMERAAFEIRTRSSANGRPAGRPGTQQGLC